MIDDEPEDGAFAISPQRLRPLERSGAMYLLVFVLNNPSHLPAVLDAWSDAGVPGITILDSTGIQRMQERAVRHGIPMAMGFSRLLRTDQYGHNTLFAVVPEMATIERAVAATEAVVGDLTQPHTGILFAVPVAAAWGLAEQASGTVAE